MPAPRERAVGAQAPEEPNPVVGSGKGTVGDRSHCKRHPPSKNRYSVAKQYKQIRIFATMANTYLKIYLHVVFAVKNRDAYLSPHSLPRIHGYMAETLRQTGQHPIAIGGTENHVHILLGFNGKIPIADMVRDLKTSTNKFINRMRLSLGRFEWQTGYGCFSYSHSHVPQVRRYVINQIAHHKGRTFNDEIKSMLDNFGIDYQEQYLFEDA